jgi:hypothetical protein
MQRISLLAGALYPLLTHEALSSWCLVRVMFTPYCGVRSSSAAMYVVAVSSLDCRVSPFDGFPCVLWGPIWVSRCYWFVNTWLAMGLAWLLAFLPCPAGLPLKVCSLATASLGLVGVH